MASQFEIDKVDQLVNELRSRQYKRLLRRNYYRGAQRLKMMGLSTPPEMRDLQTVVNWCRTTVDALAERLDPEGFRTGDKSLDSQMWEWWKRNKMRTRSDMGHIEALTQGSAFIVVGKNPLNPKMPRFSVESSAVISVELDQLGDDVEAAVRYYRDKDQVEHATLYLPDVTVWLARQGGSWVEEGRDAHALGVVPVVPLSNRVAVDDHFGETEMKDVMSIVDAVCRTATNLSTASETLAVPSRYVAGAKAEDFIDPATGEPVPVWEAYLGRLNALTDPDAKVFQLSGADLKNFTETIRTYGQLTSSVTGLPLHYLGVTADANPTAADAIVAAEARHVKRAERKQETFGDPWARAQTIGFRLVTETTDDDPMDLFTETVWRDASTPTQSAKTDSVVKLKQVGLIPVEGAWIELGWDQDKRDLYRSLLSDDPLERLIAAAEAPDPQETNEETESSGTAQRNE